MHDEVKLTQIITAAIIAACGVMLPILFHLVGLGSVFLPMFIPLAIGSFFLSPRYAFFTGALVPLASSLLTGMPPLYPPIGFAMMAELAVFCFIISIIKHHTALHSLVIIIIAACADRLLLYLIMAVIMPAFGIRASVFTLFDLIKSTPGIILILAITPLAVKGIEHILKRNALQ